MTMLFSICFYTGLIFAVLSFLLGQVFGLVDIDGDFDIDIDIDIPDFVLPLKPITVVSFVTVFGGVGLIGLNQGLSDTMALLAALVMGLLVATLLYRLVVLPLQRAQNTSAVSQTELLGHPAKVTLDIRGDRFGSITYHVNGNSFTAPARSLNSTDLNQGEEVIIVKIENNVFYVERSDQLFD